MRCGCTVEEVGRCGNYVEVGDKTIPLAGEHGLGDHALCGKEPVEAKVEGSLVEGQLVATSVTLPE